MIMGWVLLPYQKPNNPYEATVILTIIIAVYIIYMTCVIICHKILHVIIVYNIYNVNIMIV